MRGELTCRELVEHMDDYRSQDLPAGPRRVFDAHLAGCRSCDRYAKSYLTAVRVARAVADDEFPLLDVPEELVCTVLSSLGRYS
jgi:hypothetical protein